jgi:hypothetical protein
VTTNPERFEEYDRLSRHVLAPLVAELTNPGSTPPEELQLLLDTAVELPDGRLTTARQLTADDYSVMQDYMHAHMQKAVGEAGLN